MKKVLVITAIALMAGSSVFAAGSIRDNCGCGLGSMALGDQEPTLLSQLAATFLNGICGNQTFGISSGTLGCDPYSAVASNQRVQEYVAANMDHLAVDMAMGQGGSLEALADLLNVPAGERSNLFAKLQGSFDQVFTSSAVSSADVVANLDKVLNS